MQDDIWPLVLGLLLFIFGFPLMQIQNLNMKDTTVITDKVYRFKVFDKVVKCIDFFLTGTVGATIDCDCHIYNETVFEILQ